MCEDCILALPASNLCHKAGMQVLRLTLRNRKPKPQILSWLTDEVSGSIQRVSRSYVVPYDSDPSKRVTLGASGQVYIIQG